MARGAILAVATALVGMGSAPARAETSPSPAATSTPAAIATDSAVSPDPLAPLVREALRENLGLHADRLAVDRASAGVREARGYWFPSLTIESRHSRLDGFPNLGDLVTPAYRALNELTGATRFPTSVDASVIAPHESHLRLTQPIWNASIRAGQAAARAGRDAERENAGASARRLAADVELAYLRQAAAQRVEEIYEHTLDVVSENERVAERLVAAGRATPDAVLRARAERAGVEQSAAEAREDRLAGARELNLLLHRAPETPVDAIPDEAFASPLGIGVDAAVAHGLGHREELAGADAAVRASRAARKAAVAGSLPSLSLAFDYGIQGQDLRPAAGDDDQVISLVLTWNLFEGGREAARRAAAGYDIDRASLRRRELEERIAVEVENAHEAAAVKRAALGPAEARLAAARSAFELVRRRYDEGLATPVEFIEARTAATGAELNRVITLYEYAMRRVELERAAALRDMNDWR